MHNNLNLDLVKVNAYAKFDQVPSVCSQDTEQKVQGTRIFLFEITVAWDNSWNVKNIKQD